MLRRVLDHMMRRSGGLKSSVLLTGTLVAHRQGLAALLTAALEHLLPVLRLHAGAKAMLIGALAFTGLVRPFHNPIASRIESITLRYNQCAYTRRFRACFAARNEDC